MYNYEKINSLFKNFDTMSFLDLVINYKNLVENGYNAKIFKPKFTPNDVPTIFLVFNDRFSIYFNT